MKRDSLGALAVVCLISVTGLAANPGSPARAAGGRVHESVVGGGPADPAQFPYAVAVFRKGHLHCGGSVIAPTKVLTAAHCVQGFNVSNFTVIASRPDLKNGAVGEVIGVGGGVVNPAYTVNASQDMAVLTLVSPTSAPPVTLASPSEDAAATVQGSFLRVAGYGATNPIGFRLSRFLKATAEQVRNANKCLRAYTAELFNPATMICALGVKIPKFKRPPIHTSACSGDSGGPLVADTPAGARQVGIVSFGGAFCGLSGAPTVYSRVSAGLDFIRSQ